MLTARRSRAVRSVRIRFFLFSARAVGDREALAMGLIQRLLPAADLEDGAAVFARHGDRDFAPPSRAGAIFERVIEQIGQGLRNHQRQRDDCEQCEGQGKAGAKAHGSSARTFGRDEGVIQSGQPLRVRVKALHLLGADGAQGLSVERYRRKA